MTHQLEDILKRLNPGQLAAATADQDTLVWAGPGSGKTQVAAGRAGWLVHTGRCLPHELLVVTFTNRAVNEFRQRLEILLGTTTAGQIRVSTFHSLALSLVEMEGQLNTFDYGKRLRLISSEARRHLLSELVEKTLKEQPSLVTESYAASAVTARKRTADVVGYLISQFKTWGAYQPGAQPEQADASSPALAEDGESVYKLAKLIYPRYHQHLSVNRLLDLDDLIPHATECLKQYPKLARLPGVGVRQILLDETQDTALGQLELLLALRQASTQQLGTKIPKQAEPPLVAVGDERQAIFTYMHGGAYSHLVQSLSQPARLHLEIQYRYGPTLNQIAQQISWHLGREEVTYPARSTDDPSGRFGRLFENISLKSGQLPVTIYQAEDELEEGAFLASEIERLQKELPQTSIAVLARTHRQAHFLSQILNSKGLKYRLVYPDTETKPVRDLAAVELPTEIAEARGCQNQPAPITISTIHAAKGAEFEVVFVPGLAQGLFPLSQGRLLEDLRLFFVAVTRARYLLYLSYPLCRKLPPGKGSRLKGIKSGEGHERLAPSSLLSILP